MNIYLLETKPEIYTYGRIYDAYDAHVIAAPDANTARELAPHGDEGDIWTSPRLTKIRVVGTCNRKRAKVILSSYNAG